MEFALHSLGPGELTYLLQVTHLSIARALVDQHWLPLQLRRAIFS